MAQIDFRLQPLFAVLNEAGYDWIVSEILDTLRQGRPRLASESELESVRAKIDQQDESAEKISPVLEVEEPIIGDDQIDFVIELVKGRFENVTEMLDESMKNLRFIKMHSGMPAAEPKIAFQVDEEVRSITLEATTELSRSIDRLNEAIESWAASVRTTTGDMQ